MSSDANPQNISIMSKAVELYEKGFWVIPLHPQKKSPIFSWKKYTENRPTLEEIKQWWSENPNYNIGVILGKKQGVFVIDIDDIKDVGYFMGRYPSNYVVSTSRGAHIYITYPQSMTIPNKKMGGFDIKSDNSYVVGEGSVHPTGDIYRAIKSGNVSSLQQPDLIGLINYQEVISVNITNRNSGNTSNLVQFESASENWINSLLVFGSEKGKRDDDCTKLAGYYRGKGIPKDVARTIIISTWWANTKNKADFSIQDIDRILDSIYKKPQNSPNNQSQIQMFSSETGVKVINAGNPEPVPVVTSVSEIVTEEIPPVEWLIEGWIPKATTGMMISPPEHYKTWLMLSMAFSIGSGTSFQGYNVPNPGRVLIVQQEDSKAIISSRMSIISNTIFRVKPNEFRVHGGDVKRIFFSTTEVSVDLYTLDKLFHFGDNSTITLLDELIKQNKYSAIFIDPLYVSIDMGNYMADGVRDLYPLKHLRDVYGTSFILLHHTKKQTNSDIARGDLWGSQFLNAWVETGIQIRNKKDNAIQVKVHYKGSAPMPEREIRMNITDYVHMDILEDGVLVDNPTPRPDNIPFPNSDNFSRNTPDDDKKSIDKVEDIVMDLSITYPDIKDKKLSDSERRILLHIHKFPDSSSSDVISGTGMHKSTVSRALKTLVSYGILDYDVQNKTYSVVS